MTISVLLAAGTGAANSADVTVTDGSLATLSATGQGLIEIQPKTASGYGQGHAFGGAGLRAVQVYGPITFRAVRFADSSAGVDIEVV